MGRENEPPGDRHGQPGAPMQGARARGHTIHRLTWATREPPRAAAAAAAAASESQSRREMTRNMAAASATIATAVVAFNPLDCWRVRWQVQTGHPTMAAHFLSIVRNEGLVRGLWLPGVGCNATAAALCRGIGLGCYPTVRDWLVSAGGASEKSALQMGAAGLLSGGLGYGLSTPLWNLKTQLQAGLETGAGKAPFRNGWEGFGAILRSGGVAGLYRGASALIVRGALMNAGNTLGYDMTKTTARRHGVTNEGPVLHVTASVVAALLSSTFSVPADVVMTRYQSASLMGRRYSGPIDCARRLAREQGLGGFFRGWTPLFARVAPVYVLYLPAYEQLRRALGLDYLR